MTGAVRRLKVNRRYASFACGWCGDALALGEDGAVCEACETPHHARCWDERNGCGQAACVNAPLNEIPDSTASEEPFTEVEIRCPHCRKSLPLGTVVCSGCRLVTTPSGLYDEDRPTLQEAREALRMGFAAVFVPPLFVIWSIANNSKPSGVLALAPFYVGVHCGLVAIKKGRVAKEQIAVNPSFKGIWRAAIAQVLGAIGLLPTALGLIGVVVVILNLLMR